MAIVVSVLQLAPASILDFREVHDKYTRVQERTKSWAVLVLSGQGEELAGGGGGAL